MLTGQAWLSHINTSLSVSQTRSTWHMGSIPPVSQPESPPWGLVLCCPTDLIPRLTASHLCKVHLLWWIQLIWPMKLIGCVHTHQHTLCNPSPFFLFISPWHSGSLAFINTYCTVKTRVTTRIPAFVYTNNCPYSLSLSLLSHPPQSNTEAVMKRFLCSLAIKTLWILKKQLKNENEIEKKQPTCIKEKKALISEFN